VEPLGMLGSGHIHITLEQRGHSVAQCSTLPLLGRLSSRVLCPRILVCRMDPFLDRLNSATMEVDDHADSIYSVLPLAGLELLEEGIYLLHLLGRREGAPGVLDNRSVADIRRQRRTRIGNVKPPLVLALQRSFEWKTKIFFASPLAELETGASDHIDLTALLSRFEIEEVAEQIEMGADTKKDFAKMDEGGDMEDGVGIQINQLYPVPMEKTPEETVGRQRKSTIEEVLEDNDLISVGGRE